MPYINRKRKLIILSCVLLISMTSIFRSLARMIDILDKPVSIYTNLLYIGLALYWYITLRKRIIHPKAKLLLCTTAIMLAFWMCVRLIKYQNVWPNNTPINNFLWYCYYIPIIWATLSCFFASQYIGKAEDEDISIWWRLLYIPAVIFSLLTLTNNYHQLVFRFRSIPFSDNDYEWGPFWYLLMGFCGGLFVLAILLIHLKFRRTKRHKMIWIPLLLGMIPIIGLLMKSLGLQDLYQMPELLSLFGVIIMESCIEIGFIPANSSYEEFFENSSLPIFITDQRGKVHFQSEPEIKLTNEQVHAVRTGAVMLDSARRLSSKKIRGGYVLWVEDLSDLVRQNENLSGLKQQLSEEVELIRAENEIQKKVVSVREKELLYGKISDFCQPYINRIEACIRKQDYQRACFLTSYVKRRTNLMILAEESGTIDSEELVNCLRELSLYSKLLGIQLDFNRGERKSMEGSMAFRMLDQLVEAIWSLDGKIDEVKAQFVNTKEDKIMLSLSFLLEENVVEGRLIE